MEAAGGGGRVSERKRGRVRGRRKEEKDEI